MYLNIPLPEGNLTVISAPRMSGKTTQVLRWCKNVKRPLVLTANAKMGDVYRKHGIPTFSHAVSLNEIVNRSADFYKGYDPDYIFVDEPIGYVRRRFNILRKLYKDVAKIAVLGTPSRELRDIRDEAMDAGASVMWFGRQYCNIDPDIIAEMDTQARMQEVDGDFNGDG